MNTIKYIGIDVHQATSVFAIRDSRGNIIGESILKIIDKFRSASEKYILVSQNIVGDTQNIASGVANIL
jgi:hypothetical protein